MRHRDHLHHRPRVWRDRRWIAACPCGWFGTHDTQHAAFIRALAHAEGNLR